MRLTRYRGRVMEEFSLAARLRMSRCTHEAHLVLFVTLSLFFVWCTPSAAQERRSAPAQASELGRENLSRVAASAADIKTVLIKDAGLRVELKRWIAKDATGHGQIISESDLTDDAVFERLEADVQFRSIATMLVQRYGYLVPKLNPQSQLAKEQELL